MDRFWKSGLLAGFILVSGALLGCGGGGNEAPPAEQPAPVVEEPAITQSQLIDEGNQICAEVNAAIGTIESSSTSSSATSQSQLATIYDGLADRLEELGKPTDGAAPVAVIAAARALGQPDGGSAEEFRQAAEEYGLDACATEPRAPDPSGPGNDGDSGATPAPSPAPAPAPAPSPAPAPPSGGSGGAGGPPSGGISPG